MNIVLFKIFGAMAAKDSYMEISSHFGIHPLEQSDELYFFKNLSPPFVEINF